MGNLSLIRKVREDIDLKTALHSSGISRPKYLCTEYVSPELQVVIIISSRSFSFIISKEWTCL